MRTKEIIAKALPLYWIVQGGGLLFIKSTEIFIAAMILLLMCFVKMIIKNRNYDAVFLVICSLFSVCFGVATIIFDLFFNIPFIFICIAVLNFLVIIYMLRLYGN